jgi:hypothetical protein
MYIHTIHEKNGEVAQELTYAYKTPPRCSQFANWLLEETNSRESVEDSDSEEALALAVPQDLGVGQNLEVGQDLEVEAA